MLTVGVKSQQLLVDFMARMAKRDTATPLDPLNISGAMLNLVKAMGGADIVADQRGAARRAHRTDFRKDDFRQDCQGSVRNPLD